MARGEPADRVSVTVEARAVPTTSASAGHACGEPTECRRVSARDELVDRASARDELVDRVSARDELVDRASARDELVDRASARDELVDRVSARDELEHGGR